MTTVLTVVAALALLHWLARIGEAWRARTSPFRVRAGQYPPLTTATAPLVSILIPARDEEGNIERCVRSVLAQDHPSLNVVVLDDRSSDRTAEIVTAVAAEEPHVRLLSGSPLPDGWKGKCHALRQAATAADGEWLLMVDADVKLHPSALTIALGSAREHDAVMVSWFGRLETVTFWERLLQPFILDFILTHSDPRKVNDLARPDCIANGQFILVRADAYEELGGHESVKDSIVEDMAFARLVKARGLRYRLLDTLDLMQARMYTSLDEVRAGWTKNFHAGLLGRTPVVIAALIYLLLTGVVPIATLAIGIGLACAGSLHPLLVGASAASACALVAYRALVVHRATPPSALSIALHPVAALMLAGIIVDSTRRAASGRTVTWKGREYDAG